MINYLIIIALFFTSIQLSGQKAVDKLEKNKKQLENNIKYTNKLINETKNKKNKSISEITLINKQINYRTELINAYSNEIAVADTRIINLKQNIDDLQHDLVVLKKLYGELVYQSYKARNSTDIWVFIFSSKTIYQAYSRIKYIQQANQYKRSKAKQIVSKQGKLSDDIAYLNRVKDERKVMMASKEQENNSLVLNKTQKQKLIESLKGEEKKLYANLEKQKVELNSLNDKIKKVIEDEIKRSKQASAKNTQSTKQNQPNRPKEAQKPNDIQLSPEEEKLATNFGLNKGKLPWPLERGVIVSRFGIHKHAILQTNEENRGVDFRTEVGAYARAVFDGQVLDVIQITRYKAVLIKHGNYVTVYSNLQSVNVSKGDNVKTKQRIGLIRQDSETQETILHFEVHNVNVQKPENPENWLL